MIINHGARSESIIGIFLCSPKEEYIVVALSVRPSVRLSVNLCTEHISKSIEGNSMRRNTLIESHEEDCTMQEPWPYQQYLQSSFPFIFAIKSLSGACL